MMTDTIPQTNDANRSCAGEPGSAPRWKPMDVCYGDTIRGPRRLILEVSAAHNCSRYTWCCESGDVGRASEWSMKTFEEWIEWLERFSDEITGREMREAREAARSPFTEPESWRGFRERYAATGEPWIQ